MRKFLWGSLIIAITPLAIAQDTSATAGQPSNQTLQTAPSSSVPVQQPRVFITDSQSWEMEGSAAGSNGGFAAQSHGGARPQTAEIIKTFGQRCPTVTVNNKQELADYIVLLDHEGGKGALRHKDKVAVFEHSSGDVVVSRSTLSVGGSVEDACKGILSDWSAHGAALIAAKSKPSGVAAPTAVAVALPDPQPVQQTASVTIESSPPGADIDVDGAFVGSTPSTVMIAAGNHAVTVSKKGFINWTRKLNVTGGSLHLNAELDSAGPPAAAPPPTAPAPQ